MRIVIVSIFCLLLFSCHNAKQGAGPTSRHSAVFNSSVQSAMDSYHELTEAFVNWDSARVSVQAGQLQTRLDSVRLDELTSQEKEPAARSLALARKDLQSIAADPTIADKRRGLHSLTQHLYAFLKDARYDEKKIYLQECPMAFNETEPGDWLSESDSVRNPYLGLHHPRYGKAMIDCGQTKSTIDFTNK